MDTRDCVGCGRPITEPPGKAGRPRKYHDQTCREAARRHNCCHRGPLVAGGEPVDPRTSPDASIERGVVDLRIAAGSLRLASQNTTASALAVACSSLADAVDAAVDDFERAGTVR